MSIISANSVTPATLLSDKRRDFLGDLTPSINCLPETAPIRREETGWYLWKLCSRHRVFHMKPHMEGNPGSVEIPGKTPIEFNGNSILPMESVFVLKHQIKLFFERGALKETVSKICIYSVPDWSILRLILETFICSAS